jgi:AraC-like DNA-binding protein/quercetin dioxygenase-like cupin family protein
MTTTILPPYLIAEPEEDPRVIDAYFDWFEDAHHRHHSLPLVMRRDYYESGESSGTFRHNDFLGLYVVRSGRAVHWIDNHSYGLVRGDVYLMAPGSTHRFCQFTELELDVFFFQNTLFNNEELAALRECAGIWRLFAGDIEMEHRIHLRPEVGRLLEAQIEVMRQLWGNTTRAGVLRLKNEFFHLLVDLADLLGTSSQVHIISDTERYSNAGLTEALRFCEEHFDKPLSVPKLAARAFLSPGHFSELFSREVGMPPAAYVRHLRLDKACTLLRDTKIPIAQIATQCGFKNAAQFSRTFHHFYENSPMQYRQKERRKTKA